MTKTTILLVALWLLALSFLIIALTDALPSYSLKEHRFLVGIGFIAITRFLLFVYKKTKFVK